MVQEQFANVVWDTWCAKDQSDGDDNRADRRDQRHQRRRERGHSHWRAVNGAPTACAGDTSAICSSNSRHPVVAAHPPSHAPATGRATSVTSGNRPPMNICRYSTGTAIISAAAITARKRCRRRRALSANENPSGKYASSSSAEWLTVWPLVKS